MAAQQRAYNDRQFALAERSYRPPAESVARLRGQQAEFKKAEHAAARDNSWLAIPALGPAAAVIGLETAGLLAARLGAPLLRRPPHSFTERGRRPPGGHSYAARFGMERHNDLGAKIAQKPGWEYGARIDVEGGKYIKPDVQTPARIRPKGLEPEPYLLELKPNTPSGRKAAEKAVKRYNELTGLKTRAIFYEPPSR